VAIKIRETLDIRYTLRIFFYRGQCYEGQLSFLFETTEDCIKSVFKKVVNILL